MAVYTLENDYLVVTVDAHGAEVISVISKLQGKSICGTAMCSIGIGILQFCFLS